MTHVLLPFMVLPIYSVILGIPRNLMPAAASMGAGPVAGLLARAAAPESAGLLSGSLLVFMVAIGYYITPALLGGANDQMISSVIAFYATGTANWGLAGALGLILLVVTTVLYIIYGRLLDVPASAGSVEAMFRALQTHLRHRDHHLPVDADRRHPAAGLHVQRLPQLPHPGLFDALDARAHHGRCVANCRSSTASSSAGARRCWRPCSARWPPSGCATGLCRWRACCARCSCSRWWCRLSSSASACRSSSFGLGLRAPISASSLHMRFCAFPS